MIDYLYNPSPLRGGDLDPRDFEILSKKGTDRVARVLKMRDSAAETKCYQMRGLAQELGLGEIWLKDESTRLGLGSFKALGGAYAAIILVLEEASRRLGREIAPEDLTLPEVREVAEGMIFACATDGNHGRSVAQGAQYLGAKSVIFIHEGVSHERAAAIASFGADVRRVPGGYDNSIRVAAKTAEAEGWTILSDTAWDGYDYIPALVTQGYTIMVREALARMPGPPTHVFVQAGVGGLAAAVSGHLAVLLGKDRPHVTVVEPERAACIQASARLGRAAHVPEGPSTIMAMLECFEASPLAWRVLERTADGFMTLPEEAAPAVMRRLANPVGGDPVVISGESGGAGLAGLIRVMEDPGLAAKIGLGPSSRVLVINSEGATDAGLYAKITGKSPAEVLGAA